MLLPSLKFIQDELDDARTAASEQVSEMGNPNYIDDAYSEDQDGTEASHLQDNVTVSSYVSNSTKKSSQKSEVTEKPVKVKVAKGVVQRQLHRQLMSLKSSGEKLFCLRNPKVKMAKNKRRQRRNPSERVTFLVYYQLDDLSKSSDSGAFFLSFQLF